MQPMDWTWAILLTLFLEALTCLFRFGLDLQSTRDTAWVSRLTLGLRVHHGYVGMALLAICPFFESGPICPWLAIAGLALMTSDAIHHYLVLWPVTGRPQFDLLYPESRLHQLARLRRLDRSA